MPLSSATAARMPASVARRVCLRAYRANTRSSIGSEPDDTVDHAVVLAARHLAWIARIGLIRVERAGCEEDDARATLNARHDLDEDRHARRVRLVGDRAVRLARAGDVAHRRAVDRPLVTQAGELAGVQARDGAREQRLRARAGADV